MENDTRNSLTDFDMCLSLAQKAINSQMKAAWETWIARSEFGNVQEMKDFALINIFPLKNDGKPSKYGLEGEFAPLTVSLNVPSGKLGQVLVTLHLQSGTVTYFDEEEEEKVAYPFKDWSVSFITDLDKQPCDLATLDRIDSDISQSVKETILKSGLPDSVFSIEYLFMKFTQVDLLLSDNKNVNIPDDVPEGARTKALTSLNAMLQGNNGEFMMGTVVRRSKTKSNSEMPTFALTDFIFNVKADPVAPEASTLSYLGMFARRPLPNNIDAARLNLEDNWVRPERLNGSAGLISGTMAISRERFVEQYLIDKVSRNLGPAPTKYPDLTWYFSDTNESRRDTSDIINRKWNTGRAWDMQIAVVPGTNTFKVSGRISSYAYMDGYTKSFNIGIGGDWGNHHTEWIHAEGHRTFSSTLTLTGGTIDNGTDFDLEPTLSPISFSAVKVDKDEVKGGANVLNFFEGLFKDVGFVGSTTKDRLQNQQAETVEYLKISLENALKKIEMDLSAQSFIPPGGGVFTFQRPRFSNAGDLLFDVIYKAP